MIKEFRVVTTFTFKNIDQQGKLDGTVKGKKKAAEMVKVNREWLKVKGHTEIKTIVEEVQ